MKRTLFLMICLAAVLLSAGCNNSQKEAKDSTATTVAQTSSGGLADEVKNLFSGRPAEYMVEYKSTMSVDNDQAKSMHAYYYRGDQMRIDMSNEAMETRFYTNKEEYISCTKQGEVWGCLKMQDAQNQPREKEPAQDMDELKKNIEEEKATRLPERVIAGVTCKCFYSKITINMPSAKETGMSEIETTYCVSPEGIPLYIESKTENMHSIQEATGYSTRVADADFIPPAEPKTMEEALGGGSQPDQQPQETLPADFKEQQCEACGNMQTEESKQECVKMFKC
jgi:hypothetical protein